MLNIDGINIYTKTMITCDEDLVGPIYVGREELKVRSIGHCRILEEDAMHLVTGADVSAHVCNIRPEDTYRRKIKLGPKTTGQRLNRALHVFHRLYQSQFFWWSF